MSFISINPKTENFNVFSGFADKWTLITANGFDGGFNSMTASWGGMGYIWNKPVFTCVIRPQRYTFNFSENGENISLCFFDEKYRDALKIMGSKSGRDTDKIALTGLTPISENGFTYYKEANTVFLGKKLYRSVLQKDGFVTSEIPEKVYAENDYHIAYTCEIVGVLKSE